MPKVHLHPVRPQAESPIVEAAKIQAAAVRASARWQAGAFVSGIIIGFAILAAALWFGLGRLTNALVPVTANVNQRVDEAKPLVQTTQRMLNDQVGPLL